MAVYDDDVCGTQEGLYNAVNKLSSLKQLKYLADYVNTTATVQGRPIATTEARLARKLSALAVNGT